MSFCFVLFLCVLVGLGGRLFCFLTFVGLIVVLCFSLPFEKELKFG